MSNRRKNSFLRIAFLGIPILMVFYCTSPKTEKVQEKNLVKNYNVGPINLDLILNKTELTIAETLQLKLVVKIKKEYEVQFPSFGEKLNQFQIRDYNYHQPKLVDKDHIKVSTAYWLDPYLSGEYSIPSLKVKFWTTEEGQDKAHEIETEEVKITVKSLLPKDYKALSIKDIKGPLTPPSHTLITTLIILGALLIVGATTWFIVYSRKRREKAIEIKTISAHEAAFERLKQLVARKLIEDHQIKEFYYSISDILREYIEDRFNLRAPEQTTEEFLGNLREKEDLFSAKQKEILVDFLNHCDLVKFAKLEPAKREIQKTFDSCKEFIMATQDNRAVIPESKYQLGVIEP
jgi:hypothetical protein